MPVDEIEEVDPYSVIECAASSNTPGNTIDVGRNEDETDLYSTIEQDLSPRIPSTYSSTSATSPVQKYLPRNTDAEVDTIDPYSTVSN